jgi:hypothetical protein
VLSFQEILEAELMAMALPTVDWSEEEDSQTKDGRDEIEWDLFTETFEGDTEADDEEAILEEESSDYAKLSISKELARSNYIAAGEEIPEAEPSIKIEKYEEAMRPEVVAMMDQLVSDIGLPYELTDAQKIGIAALGSGRSVVMVTPTGSGKMTVPLVAALLNRRTQNRPKGVACVTQPLTGLQAEQLKNPVCPVAIISMTGSVVTSLMPEAGSEDGEQNKAKLSCTLADLLEGKYPVLLGHPESFASKLGVSVMKELKKRDQVVLIAIDEFHTGSAWVPFRPDIMLNSCALRSYAQPETPVIVMSATATKVETKLVKKQLGLRGPPPVLIAESPVHNIRSNTYAVLCHSDTCCYQQHHMAGVLNFLP